ncbi:hypothetical protein I6E52_09245 [Salinibacterium sp. NG253]|uniref:hypothetical protein n=1 Tax=Salinibacterium sp. NG253 TaxID=2792039 RepID=UPI0018CF4D55|nr:hypothetical protein [Salinibacterium sp. NG253]MBH0117029.1 hypothetical protein [Salinibacterium sp. NG253]
MPLDARTLLSGPRGRRLCVAVAQHDPEGAIPAAASLGYLLVYAAHHLEKARGQGGAIFGWGIPDPLPEPSVEDIAEALDSIPLTPIGIAEALEACAASVDSARYWQEPDGRDELLADSRLERSLMRVAEHIVTSPMIEWWSDPVAPQQWAVNFRDRLADPTADDSGGWWSRPPFGLTATTRALPDLGPVGLWLVEDRSDEKPADIHSVAYEGTPRVFEIVAAESWAELCRRYPLEITATRRHDWYRTTGRSGKWMMPDWSRVAHDFDAVHLTLAAYLSAAGVVIPLDDGFASVIAGWNPDETYWFTDVVTHAGSDATWMRDEQTGRWWQLG